MADLAQRVADRLAAARSDYVELTNAGIAAGIAVAAFKEWLQAKRPAIAHGLHRSMCQSDRPEDCTGATGDEWDQADSVIAALVSALEEGE